MNAFSSQQKTAAKSQLVSISTSLGSPLQRKSTLRVGAPDDAYEREADRAADAVASDRSLASTGLSLTRIAVADVQREDAVEPESGDEKKEHGVPLQRKVTSDSITPSAPSMVEDALASPGQPLDSSTRRHMEVRFGHDFSNVQVHTGTDAEQSARVVNARAYTVGRDVVFGEGRFTPNTSEGQRLIAHELAHVVQQSEADRTDFSRVSDLVIQRALLSPRFTGDATLVGISNGTGTLSNGDTGDAVRRVQQAIADSGILYRAYGVDGIFGDETERTVRRFQRNNGVSGDPSGEVGQNTLEELDQLFPAMAFPATAGNTYTNLSGILAILSQWNAAMIRDLRNLRVHMVADLYWADESWNGTNWSPARMDGAGETSGSDIYIATDATNEEVASSLYHEYQHARAPYSYRNRSWTEEEERVYTLQTQWEIDRGMTTDPSLTTTDPVTGATEVNPGGVTAQVQTYPGLAATQPGEVIGKVGSNRVRVQLPNGRRIIRNAALGDSVPGRRVTIPPIHNVRAAEWVT
jgi:peptidoglycan hydrolase-like protein with peptidoglycan-binding domain